MSNSTMNLLERDARPRILLVGDVMLDRYLWGDVERISPEAPIPILRISRQEHRLGGAGSVASMLATLGAQTILAAVVGDDDEGRIVRELLDNLEINSRLVLTVRRPLHDRQGAALGRAQQRYPHQMMRVDRETDAADRRRHGRPLLAGIARCIDEIDLVLVSDYNKGVCKGEMIPRLVELARAAGVPVIADPVKDADYHRYAGCTCITPNRAEAGRALGTRITTPQEGLEAGRRLLDSASQSVHRHAGPRRHGLGRSLGPAPAVPRPAAAGVRHHRRRRHGAVRVGLHVGRRGRSGRRPSKWPTWPAGWRSSGWASCRSRAARSWPNCSTASQRPARRSCAWNSSTPRCDATAAGRQADRDDQRLLRPAAPRPRRLASGGPQAGRLPAGGRQQRPQRAGAQGAGPPDHRPAGPGRNAGRAWPASITS